jgi:hypothetical protein
MSQHQYRQGDILLVSLRTPPEHVTRDVERSGGRLILAEGEATGHAHTIISESAELVTSDQAAELYLLVHGDEPVELLHQEHDAITIAPGTYKVVRQREYTPEAIRQVAD